MQVSAHKDAVSLFERYAKGGEDPKLKYWAAKTLPALQHHLRWRRTWARQSNRGEWRSPRNREAGGRQAFSALPALEDKSIAQRAFDDG
jgi:hypothetical protein